MSEQEQIRSTIEIMVHWLSQHVRDGAVIHIGAYTPLALASALLAKLTHAPNAALDSPATLNAHVPYSIPITLRLLEGSQCSQAMQTHRQVVHIEGPDGCDFEPIAAAQIDRFGNINNSVIGSFDEPKIRLPGPAGIDTLTSMLTRTVSLYTTRHTPRTFVSDVDVVTGLGHRRHGKTRADLGYPVEGGAPQQVITNLGILDFGGSDRHMRLTHVHPGVTVEQVQAATGFELPVSADLGETEAPDEETRRLIWQEIDPMDTLMLEFEAQRDRLPNLRRLLDLERERYMGVPWRWPRLESGTASA